MSIDLQEEDSLERLKKRLEGEHGKDIEFTRSSLDPVLTDYKKGWDKIDMAGVTATNRHSTKKPLLNKLLYVSIAFFVVTLVVAGWLLFSGSTLVSSNNIDILIQGPSTIKSGDEVSLQIMVTNRNQTALEDATLIVNYPVGTRSADSPRKEMLSTKEGMSSLPAGATANKTSRALIFGQQNEEKNIIVRFEYRLPGSNALFFQEKNFKTIVSASPLDITLNLPNEINSGREINLDLKIVSNSQSILKNLLLQVNYPPGFIYKSAEPAPVRDNNLWSLGDLAGGNQKNLKIIGTIEGQSEEVKTFRITTGVGSEEMPQKMAAFYGDILKTMTVKRPFVNIALAVNNSTEPIQPISAGGIVSVGLNWRNNLPVEVRNNKIQVFFDGKLVLTRSIRSGGAYYDSGNNSITWDQTNTNNLDVLKPGAGGSANFTFELASLLTESNKYLKNQIVNLGMVFTGTRINADNSSEEIRTEVKKILKINTALAFRTNASYQSEAFTNSGPIPPKVGQETSYTIIWTLGNTANEVANASISATLPTYVRWLNNVYPSSEQLSYDATTQRVIWNLGVVRAGTGVGNPPREVAFQVALTPSVSQEKSIVPLLGEAIISATDIFSGGKISFGSPQTTTDIKTDPTYFEGAGIVASVGD